MVLMDSSFIAEAIYFNGMDHTHHLPFGFHWSSELCCPPCQGCSGQDGLIGSSWMCLNVTLKESFVALRAGLSSQWETLWDIPASVGPVCNGANQTAAAGFINLTLMFLITLSIPFAATPLQFFFFFLLFLSQLQLLIALVNSYFADSTL